MIAAVLDTNVIVSGLLSPEGVTGRIIDAISDGFCRPVFSEAILIEYEEVLARPKFFIAQKRIETVLITVRSAGLVAPFAHARHRDEFPDEDDLVFVDAAMGADVPLVTGNLRHFPAQWMQGVRVLSPKTFLEMLE